MTEQPRVICEVCLKHITKLDALVTDERNRPAYFCGPRCYGRWLGEHAPAAAARQESTLAPH
jgi:hypothetical protein